MLYRSSSRPQALLRRLWPRVRIGFLKTRLGLLYGLPSQRLAVRACRGPQSTYCCLQGLILMRRCTRTVARLRTRTSALISTRAPHGLTLRVLICEVCSYGYRPRSTTITDCYCYLLRLLQQGVFVSRSNMQAVSS